MTHIENIAILDPHEEEENTNIIPWYCDLQMFLGTQRLKMKEIKVTP